MAITWVKISQVSRWPLVHNGSNTTLSGHQTPYSVISGRFTGVSQLSLATKEGQEHSPHFTLGEAQKRSAFPSVRRLQPSEQGQGAGAVLPPCPRAHQHGWVYQQAVNAV